MKDPYQVLGISRGASDDEVKKAYRAQCKRWHPDLNPGDASAEEKFKDVQAAYDSITKGEADAPQGAYGNPYGQSSYGGYGQRSYGQSSYGSAGGQNAYDPFGFGFGTGGFGGTYGGQRQTSGANYSSSDNPQMQAARNYIVNGQYAQARRILDSMQGGRSARWYYLSALAYNGMGQSIDALKDARMANQMEPNNNDYRTLLSQLQNPGQNYYRRTATYGGGGASSWCWRLILLNLFCQCCGGGQGCYYPMMFCR